MTLKILNVLVFNLAFFMCYVINKLFIEQSQILPCKSLGGALGPPVFSLKGNQGKGWKPAEVKSTSTENLQVCNVLKSLYESPLYLK